MVCLLINAFTIIGVMPQTLESIKLAQKDNVPLIVALNKMDKRVDKRVDAIKRDLMSAGVELEGKTYK